MILKLTNFGLHLMPIRLSLFGHFPAFAVNEEFFFVQITQKVDRKVRPSVPAQKHRQIFEFINFKAFGEFGCN